MKKILILILTVSVMISVMMPLLLSRSYAADKEIDWTREEAQFIKNHPVIKLGVDPEFVPFEFIDEDGKYKGIAADYLDLISEKTGLKFEIQKGLTWPEAYDMAVNGEIDALPLIGKTSEREEHFIFSEPYYYFKRVIVTRETEKGISNLKDLEGKIVAVQRNSSHHSYLLEHSEINISLYDSVEAGLTAVATGKERAFIGNLATTNYMIHTHGLTGLRYIAFEAQKAQALHFAVRKDWPELVSIFDKAMDAVTEKEKTAINNKWVDLQTDIGYGPIIRIIIIVGSVIAIVFIVSFFWIVRLQKEIRRRKKVQKDLEKAKLEADEANEFKSNFLARMSHEIRTPLNAITGISYLLKKTDISFTQSMYVDRIMRAADNMLGIVNDILDFAKIEAGKIELEKVPFSMDATIREVVNIVSYKIEEQGIRFRVFKDPAIADWFIGDSNRIQQILQNVLGNASKFTKAGEISLDVSLVSKKGDTHLLRFSVRDTGIGMTEEQKQKLFSPFIQADSSINRRFGGSGLGLSIVKNLVEMMKGEVRVNSVPGEGSEFIIEISLDPDKQKQKMYQKMLSMSSFKEAKVLILQKKDSDMEPVCEYLSYFGMACETVFSEKDAIQRLEASLKKSDKPFDLIMTGCGKSSGSGFEFIKNLRNNTSLTEIPIVIMLIPMNRYDLFDKLHENGIKRGIAQPVTPYNILNEVIDALGIKKDKADGKAYETEQWLPLKKGKYHAVLADDNKT
ncbi:MAG TPA: transporter substrate-binding domain-containing protein, partial [Bacillota bacterium]|nr:transporter substrate-binding domain-containing protein [Bacillota bacterium]